MRPQWIIEGKLNNILAYYSHKNMRIFSHAIYINQETVVLKKAK